MNTQFKWGTDKILHIAVGFYLMLVMFFIFQPLTSLILYALVGLGKEWYDYEHPETNTACWWDLGFTILGSVVALGFLILVLGY